MQLWADLKHIQYGLNWRVLESVLPDIHTAHAPRRDAALNKNLLGFSTDSSTIGRRAAPAAMQDRHIDSSRYREEEVLQEDIDRNISHIAHSLRNGIDCYLTTDGQLAEKFAERKQNLQLALGTSIHLEVLRPTELERRLG
jgi:hypothetical protein